MNRGDHRDGSPVPARRAADHTRVHWLSSFLTIPSNTLKRLASSSLVASSAS
ncbi:MAG: hypothetical protein LBD01_00800 [Puniceicoccales bacterium]|nr:hypothetical protein [Puniceicoccales bacterium]